jgi:hypothetical protein
LELGAERAAELGRATSGWLGVHQPLDLVAIGLAEGEALASTDGDAL